jgi:hypothetical protein
MMTLSHLVRSGWTAPNVEQRLTLSAHPLGGARRPDLAGRI